MSQALNEMRPIGETDGVPMAELARTTDGDAAAYVPIDLDGRSDDGEHGGSLPEDPPGAKNEEKFGRGVATASYCRRYRQMRPLGVIGRCRNTDGSESVALDIISDARRDTPGDALAFYATHRDK